MVSVSVGLCLTSNWSELSSAVWTGAHDDQRARARALVERARIFALQPAYDVGIVDTECVL